jgi:signal peptidase I
VVETAVLFLVAVLVMRTWLLEGLFLPLVVPGGSMAETLLGVHRSVVCEDCGHRFVCGSDIEPVAARAVCPNCGYWKNDLEGLPDVAGDRLLMHKSIFRVRPPRRWEVVVLRDPARADRRLVKRVVGLPGESIRIRRGDVYVNGEIQRKPLWLQRATAVLVYDADRPPRLDRTLPDRWQGERPDTPWGSVDGRFAHPAAGPTNAGQANGQTDDGPIDWLHYGHWHRVPGSSGQAEPAPITDICGYNPLRPRRVEETNIVGDLLLSLRVVKTFGRGRLVLRANDGREEFWVWIDPGQERFEVTRGGKPIPEAAGRLPGRRDGLTVELSLFDRQLLVAIDGRTVVTYPYDSPDGPPRSPPSRPLSIGSQGLGVEIRHVRVVRDIYYTHPVGREGRWALDRPVRLGAGEYFVLGDNSPISRDSRTWPAGPVVHAKLLVGKPLIVHFPAHCVKLGRWHFQVPDPAGIRYIR